MFESQSVGSEMRSRMVKSDCLKLIQRHTVEAPGAGDEARPSPLDGRWLQITGEVQT